jgi:hypothetical protein
MRLRPPDYVRSTKNRSDYWLNQDPIGERGGINLYRAMDNDPVNEIDPYGLDNIYNMGAANNAVPNITLSGPVGGGAVNTQFNGGGLGDPLFLIGGMTGGPGWLTGDVEGSVLGNWYLGDVFIRRCPPKKGSAHRIVHLWLELQGDSVHHTRSCHASYESSILGPYIMS